jgi:hypothetical protein
MVSGMFSWRAVIPTLFWVSMLHASALDQKYTASARKPHQVSLTRSMMLGALAGNGFRSAPWAPLKAAGISAFRLGRLPLGILQFGLDPLDLHLQLLHWTLHAVDLIQVGCDTRIARRRHNLLEVLSAATPNRCSIRFWPHVLFVALRNYNTTNQKIDRFHHNRIQVS